MYKVPDDISITNFDFGFTVVEDPDSDSPLQNSVNTEAISAPIIDRIRALETNLEEVLSILGRIEQGSTPNLDTDEYKQLIEKDVREKLKKVETMVMPLLTNLLKDADTKEYIKWPNRRPIIESFIEKFLAVTRS